MSANALDWSHHQAADLDELAYEVERVGYRMDRTPIGGTESACALRIARGPHFFCVVESTSVAFRNSFATPAHLVAFAVGLQGTAPWRYAGASHGFDHIRLVPPGRETETVTSGPQVMAHFGFSRAWLEGYEGATRSSDLGVFARTAPGVLWNPKIAARLRGLVARMFAPDGSATLRSEELVEGLAEAIAGAATPGSRALPLRPQRHEPTLRTLRVARRVIDDRLPGTLRLQDVCREVGVSRRTLERAFREQLGLTPWTYVLTRRLLHARRLLRRSRPEEMTARAAAKASGLSHAGRFSAQYRSLFGELPSETLRGS